MALKLLSYKRYNKIRGLVSEETAVLRRCGVGTNVWFMSRVYTELKAFHFHLSTVDKPNIL